MKKDTINKLKPYLLTSAIVLGIMTIIFLIKGIYPFGNNSLIWGDMHDQITAFYYHLYDSVKGGKSLLIDFTSSGGINFLGIIAYYILSPFSLLVLLIPRSDIYLFVSVIIAIKILMCSITCLYFIKKYYKKLPNLLSVLLAIIYAFSGFSLMMYQITPWIDTMYMLPLIIIGLKKVLDIEKPTMYIITLTLSLIFSFYTSIMVIIFIFLVSLIYLFVYKEKKEARKKAILSLGISTLISLLIASFIIIPAYSQISISSRINSGYGDLLNSKTGPITDKLSMFLFGGLMYTGLLFLLKEYKKNFKYLTFYIPTLLIVLIPVIIEPINKAWHFGSYAFFPYRFGFITMFLLVMGACHGFNNYKEIKGIEIKKGKIISTILTLVISISTFIIMYVNYNNFQTAIETLTISGNHTLLLILVLSLIACIVGCFIVILLNKKLNKFSLILISILTITHIIVNTSIYLGMDKEQEILMGQYRELNSLNQAYKENDYYRIKNEADNMITNSSIVSNYHNLDHFTSLTDKNNIETLKKIGYSSSWVKTNSRGGNLFIDSIMANKYIINRKKTDYQYYDLKGTYGKLYFYELTKEPSYGYLLSKNDTIFDKENSFEISNSLYQSITENDDNIFEIKEDFTLNNIEAIKDSQYTNYEIIDPEMINYLEQDIKITGKKTVYLEILRSIANIDNLQIYRDFNIYINDKLFAQQAFHEDDNGVMNLGTYENKTINLKIVLRENIGLNNITVGLMDNVKYEKFIEEEKIDTDIKFYKNKIDVNINSEEEKILFLPLTYNEGYKATNNGKNIEILKVYDNFIGIKLSKGENNINISFMPKGFIIGLIISTVTLILTVIIIKTNLYEKLLNIKLLNNLAYYVYLVIYLGIILVIYIGLTLAFIISYFKYINV